MEKCDCTSVNAIPSSDTVLETPELQKAVKLLTRNYEQGLQNAYVRNPLAWALYRTWREIDGGADNA